MNEQNKLIVELAWRVIGQQVPADHGYALFGALSNLVPTIHEEPNIGILPLNGKVTEDRKLHLDKYCKLRIRLPYSLVSQLYLLSGKSLSVAHHPLRLGVPELSVIRPARSLYSRLVVIKGYTEEHSFLEAVQRQLSELGITTASASIPLRKPFEMARLTTKGLEPSLTCRRTIRIKDKEIVGFALRIEDLSPEDSILLQQRGLGGRRRFGCGCFVPVGGDE